MIKKYLNKYVIVMNIIFLLMIFFLSYLFNFKLKWYYIVPILFLADYIGKVMNATLEGFNIVKINGFEIDNEYSLFRIVVVYDFKGSIVIITGRFKNEENLNIEELKNIMYNKVNIKLLLKNLENDSVNITFYNNNIPIEIEFLPSPIFGKT